MPICRAHKRQLKATRILKKENHNKEDKCFKVGVKYWKWIYEE